MKTIFVRKILFSHAKEAIGQASLNQGQIKKLPLPLPPFEEQKRIDALWADLLSEEELLASPAWHKKALQETEKRLAEGKERILDWHIAKKELRNM